MSGGPACKCGEHKEPLKIDGTTVDPERPTRLWRVYQRYGNCSAFNGYHWTASNYSCLTCLRCGRVWRTKADYVAIVPDIKDEERNISSGHAGHVEAMAAHGRTPNDTHANGY